MASWADGLQRRLAGRPWRDRAAADVKASAAEPVVEAEGGLAVPAPDRSESVREFLLRTPHPPVVDVLAVAEPLVCVCGELRAAAIHDEGQDRAMLNTESYLAGLAAELEAARQPRPWNPDGPHEYTEDDEQAGICECGSPEGNWKHREVPQEAGPVSEGWLAGGPLTTGPHAYLAPAGPVGDCMTCQAPARHPIHFDAAGVPLAAVQPPVEVSVPVPPSLPEGVLGYVVILPGRVLSASATAGGTVGWLANADLMSLEAAEHEADVTRGTLCEVRAVQR